MRFPKAFLISLVVIALLAGAWVYSGGTNSLPGSATRVSARGVLKNADPNDYLSPLINKSIYFLQTTVQSKSILFYGALALVGIIIMMLAIASTTAQHKDTADTALELLKQEKEKAENLARLKSEFLNQVSHELRTPLAVIIGYVECLTDGLYGQIDTKHHDILQVVAKQSSHLKNMIDQILIFSRLEADRQPVRVSEFSIHNIINDLKETFEFLCRQKGLALNWDISDGLRAMKTDGERVKEVLSNLLQNALKYTDQGSITVTVRELGSTDSFLLEVADTGIGIPENYLPVIFEPFRQVHKTSTENSRGGIGLGLAIVKKHVEQINGTITVDSELGKGSIFKITLPRVYESSVSRHKKLLRLFSPVRKGDRLQAVPANGANKTQPTAHWLN